MENMLVLRIDIIQNSINLWTNKNVIKIYNVDMNLLNKDIMNIVGTEVNFKCINVDIINSYEIYNKTKSFIVKGLVLVEKLESIEVFHFNNINYLNMIKDHLIIRVEDQIFIINVNNAFDIRDFNVKNKNKLSLYRYKKNILIALNDLSLTSKLNNDAIILIK